MAVGYIILHSGFPPLILNDLKEQRGVHYLIGLMDIPDFVILRLWS
jgi:hypothetical protein